ncbi:hypothetical protein [Streptomyces sp. NRRL S-1813]|uniref:hypothetical protein n=1 Tax=Streptomyces sp. NRRL S-1813 TaxID=1463888 RepID=UPI00068EC9C3|nr:hypothetical protein [Streptomyces sp. NRRL S-1813]
MGGPLKKYRVVAPSGVQTIMKLNDEEAKARGVSADDLVDAPEPDTEPEAEESAGDEAETKAAPPAPNKARSTSANKGRGARGGS